MGEVDQRRGEMEEDEVGKVATVGNPVDPHIATC